MKFGEFLDSAVQRMGDHGVSVQLKPKMWVDGSCGNFDGATFKVALKHPKWRETFLHEYCHFLQELDERARRAVNYPFRGYTASTRWSSWMSGSLELSPRALQRLRQGLQLMERDCDQRALRLARRLKLPIDLDQYTREANIYHLFYTVVERHRQWNRRSLVTAAPELLTMVPGNRLCRDYENLPEGFEEAIVTKCLR